MIFALVLFVPIVFATAVGDGEMKNSQKTAVGGLFTALAGGIIIISNIFPSGMYTFPALSGIIILILYFVAGQGVAWSSYIAVSIVSFLLCTSKESALCFMLFLGYYPLLREYIVRIKIKIVCIIIKLLIFNSAAIGIYFLLLYVFSAPESEFKIFGLNLPLIFLVILNFVFFLYDITLSLFEKKYKPIIYNLVTKFFDKF